METREFTTADIIGGLAALQGASSAGLIVAIDISAGVMSDPAIQQYLIFDARTTASHVKLIGSGKANPAAGRRRLAAQDETTLQNLTVTASGQGLIVEMRNVRVEGVTGAPAVIVKDGARLIVSDCLFITNAAGAIRMLDGTLEVTDTAFTENGAAGVRGGALQLFNVFASIFSSV